MNQKVLKRCLYGFGKNKLFSGTIKSNSNNLTTKISEGIEKVTTEFNDKLTERRDTLANNMPIVWNFKLKPC